MKRKTLTLFEPVPQGIPVLSVIERICENCRFYDDAQETAVCKKRSPYQNVSTGETSWPAVDFDDWCGDFKRLPVK